jgi:hypothetical protein
MLGNNKFWEELIAYFPLKRHGSHRKRHHQQFFDAAGTCLLSHCLANDRRILLLTDTDNKENDASDNFSLFRVFATAGTCVPNRCLAAWGDTYGQTNGSDLSNMPLRWVQAPWYTCQVNKYWFRQSKVDRRDTQTGWRSHKPNLIFPK